MANDDFPSLESVRARLRRLNEAGMRALASKSGRSFNTLNKIKFGLTKEPGFETVRAVLPFLDDLPEIVAHRSREYRRVSGDGAHPGKPPTEREEADKAKKAAQRSGGAA